MPIASGILRRREFLRQAAGVLAASAALAGCGRGDPAQGAPPAVHLARPTILLQPYGSWTGRATLQAIQDALRPFEDANGVTVRLQAQSEPTVTAANLSAMAAGDGPDVINDSLYAPYVERGLLLDLTSRMQSNHVDPTIWSSGQMALLQRPSGLFALPCSIGTMCYVLNQNAFGARISAPDASWTYSDLTQLAGQLTQGSGSTKQYGANLAWLSGVGPELAGQNDQWAFTAFGGSETSRGGTSATLTTTQSLMTGQWLYEDLLWPGYAITRDFHQMPGWELAQLSSGMVAMSVIGTWELLTFTQTVRDTIPWTIIPFPVFPNGRITFATNNFYGINAATRHPNLAWALLQWLCVDTSWQKAMMQLLLLPPARIDLWNQWEYAVGQTAPLLPAKTLQWFTDAVQQGYATPPTMFEYANQEAFTIFNEYAAALYTQPNSSVRQAFTAAEQAMNQLESTAQGAAQQATTALTTIAASPRSFPDPPTTGPGAQGSPTPYVVATSKGIILLGDGSGLSTTSDNCIFSCLPVTAPNGRWTVQLSALENLTCPHLAPGAAAGVMVRLDPSDDTTFLAIAMTAAMGVQIWLRYAYAQPPSTIAPPSPNAETGLLGPVPLKPNASGQIPPVWLRLERSGAAWQASTSRDGITWTRAGSTIQLAMAGCYVGVFATADNALFGNEGYIRALFDHLDFNPTLSFQLGTTGIPATPASVPANWATLNTAPTS